MISSVRLLQSHLYGIEIRFKVGGNYFCSNSNRTFMELKCEAELIKQGYRRLQSHLYGIEIRFQCKIICLIKALQSHLYGIEIQIQLTINQSVTRTPIAPLWN